MAEYGLYLLAALVGGGTLMSKKQEAKSDYSQGHYNDEVTGTNIYHSKDFDRHKETESKKVKKNWDDAKNPEKTGVYPLYYNSLKINSDHKRAQNPNYNNKLIFKIMEMATDSTKSKVQKGIRKAMSKPAKKSGPLGQIGGSLTPETKEDFTHNNMVPFYGRNITQDIRSQNRSKEGKLELYTGQFKMDSKKKKECKPFFQPTPGMTYIHGTPIDGQHRDLSRYKPNNTGKKHGETPIESIHVGPGLNDGFTAKPSGGLHQTLRIMPKDITDLRVDPVIESEGRVKPGASRIKKRGLVPMVYRHRPELLVENKNGERNFTTVGAVKGRTLRPKMVLKDTHRKKSRSYTAPAKSVHQKNKLRPKTQKSKRQNLKHSAFRNMVSQFKKKMNDFGRKGYTTKAKKTDGKKRHLGIAKGYTKHKSVPKDKAKKTIKETTLDNMRPCGNFGSQIMQGPSYDPSAWQARSTIKQTTQDNDHIGFHGQNGGGVQPSYDPKTWKARKTIKQTTQDNDHIGFHAPTSGGVQPSYDTKTWKARKTIKQTTQDNDHIGFHAPTSGGVQPSYDPKTWKARKTIKQTTQDNDHIGFHAPTSGGVQPSYDPKTWKARKTIKQTTQDNDHIGFHAPTSGGVQPSYDPKTWKARKTIKETTQDNDHIGFHAPTSGGVQPSYDPKTWKARKTIKETTNYSTYGNATGSKKQIAWNPKNKAKKTIRETLDQKTRYGGGASSAIVKKHAAWNTKEKARKTIRETTEKSDHMGHVSGGTSVMKGGGYATSKWDAKNTQKQFTSDNPYTGIADSRRKKFKSYGSAYNAKMNTNKEKIAKGRAPKNGGPSLGPKLDKSTLQHKKIEDDRVNKYARMKSGSHGVIYNPNMTLTSQKNQLPQTSDRIDSSILDAYVNNPLSQSLHSY
jgi:hypothetical protein